MVTTDLKRYYRFNDAYDERTPVQFWFQDSLEGRVLFVVLYTLACRWGKCTGCNLPSTSSSRPISFHALMQQTDRVFNDTEVLCQRTDIRQLILSNNGSVLDEKTFSTTALLYFVAKANILLPNLAVFTMETRSEYVDSAELEILARALREGQTPTDLEIAVGFEAYDNRIRNKIFKKGLSLRAFEELGEKIATYGFRLKCYFMQKPTLGMSDDDGVRDVEQGIDYLDQLASRFGLRINLHLNPTYVARGTALEKAFLAGEYVPPLLADVVRAIKHARGKKISVYVGLSDEGLATPGGSFLRPEEEYIHKALARFNVDQNYDALS